MSVPECSSLCSVTAHTLRLHHADNTVQLSCVLFLNVQHDGMQQAVQQAAWRQQVDQVHQQLLDQQKHKAALRERLQQDAQRAKREQLRRIEPVAKARARANGLASLGLDPQILAMSEKFGRLSSLVDEVQQRVEAQYGLMGSLDDAAAYAQIFAPPAAGAAQAALGWNAGGRVNSNQQPALQQAGNPQQQQQQQHVVQQLPNQPQATWPAAPQHYGAQVPAARVPLGQSSNSNAHNSSWLQARQPVQQRPQHRQQQQAQGFTPQRPSWQQPDTTHQASV